MKAIKKVSEGNKDSKYQNGFRWNALAGILSASQSVLFLIVITRVCGIDVAGIFSIAFATANLLSHIGLYGIRNYQVSDIQDEYKFRAYIDTRIFTFIFMILASIGYVLFCVWFRDYDSNKAYIVFFMCILKSIDVIEDVFLGRFQQRGRLDIAGRILSMRLVITIVTLILVLFVSRSLLYACLVTILVSAICSALLIWNCHAELQYSKVSWSKKAIKSLLLACFPICAGNFMSFYIINAPKYAIDVYLSETVQANYNFIAMPVFVIGLLCSFIYQPLLVKIAIQWDNKSKEGINNIVYKVLLYLLGITIVTLAGAYLFGIPILSILYDSDLSALRLELIIILIGGAFLALVGFLTALLTVMRGQRYIVWVYLLGAILAKILDPIFVKKYEIMGAVCLYTILMLIQVIIFSGICIWKTSMHDGITQK